MAETTNKKKIFIVDDHKIMVEGLSSCLNDTADLEVCGSASNAYQGLEAIDRARPDAVLVDLSLEHSHGLDLVKSLSQIYPELPVLVLSMHDETVYAERAIRAGAKGYVMKNEPFQKVEEGIRTVLSGKLYVSERIKELLLSRFQVETKAKQSPIELLSDRELEVFQLIGQGVRPRVIAERMNVSVKTVDTYCRRIREKLEAESLNELIELSNHWCQTNS